MLTQHILTKNLPFSYSVHSKESFTAQENIFARESEEAKSSINGLPS